MRVIVILLLCLFLSGCATAEYYKYLSNKDTITLELKKLEAENKSKQDTITLELKKLEAENLKYGF